VTPASPAGLAVLSAHALLLLTVLWRVPKAPLLAPLK
jgi:hypothetical protein